MARCWQARLAIPLLLSVTVIAGCGASMARPASLGIATQATHACPPRGRAVPASALRIPVNASKCLYGRKVTYRDAKTTIPSGYGRACGHASSKTRKNRVCAIHSDGGIYTLTTSVRLPRACRQRGSIPATELRVPVLRSTCDLSGRLVTFRSVGAHVPSKGTICGQALEKHDDVTICLTRDSQTVFARTSSDSL
jgi:hypothetical protein